MEKWINIHEFNGYKVSNLGHYDTQEEATIGRNKFMNDLKK